MWNIEDFLFLFKRSWWLAHKQYFKVCYDNKFLTEKEYNNLPYSKKKALTYDYHIKDFLIIPFGYDSYCMYIYLERNDF